MRLKRVGLNTMSCVITKQDMLQLDYEPENVLRNQVSEEMAELANMVIGIMTEHLTPIPLPCGLPMEVKAMIHVEDIEFEVSVPFLPFEVFDFEADYEEEIELEEEFAEEEFDEYFNQMDEESENEEDSEGTISESNIRDDTKQKENEITVMFKFKTLNDVSEYAKICKNIKQKPLTSLYKMDKYWLLCNFNGVNEKSIKQYLYILTEWKGSADKNKCKAAYIKEHGTQILKTKALETLAEL